VVEAMAEALFGDARACIKIDCAEFQHSHEIAKLIGSPPGYLAIAKPILCSRRKP
jgi:ATP-dependent Clp protease ATP-binding subunit ClpB